MICFAKPVLIEELYRAKTRIFNNVLHVRYVHLTKGKRNLFIRDKPIDLSGRMYIKI
jgi:hypothetical protein